MKRLLSLAFFALLAVATWAAKANPTPAVINQPDGTQLTIIGFGDEHFSWVTTTDGALLAQIGMAYYIASIDNNGNMTATNQLAHEPSQRNAIELSMIMNQDKDAFFSQASQSTQARNISTRAIGTMTPAYFPHTGDPHVAVILVNFQDVKFIEPDPVVSFNDYLNSPEHNLHNYANGENRNYGSVKQYFSDMSDGNFNPQFDVYGPVTVSQKMAYYGQDANDNNKDIYLSKMMQEACTLAHGTIGVNGQPLNFANYDSNSDGLVDEVYFIYAGYGQNISGNDANTIWPKSGYNSISLQIDGKTINRYGVNNELNATPSTWVAPNPTTPQINGIGVFCHEFSHTMGLTDLYPTVTSAEVNNQEMEYWDLMDGGEYVYNGYYPTPYTAWEREQMGWSTINDISTYSNGTPIYSIDNTDNRGLAYKMVNPNDNTEYMVLQNIQNSGWSTKLPGHGLLVYHVRWQTWNDVTVTETPQTTSTTVNMLDYPNNVAGKPGMAVVPADGLLISYYLTTNTDPIPNGYYSTTQYNNSQAGDPFPGTQKVSSLVYTPSSTALYPNTQGEIPNYVWYTGGPDVKQALQNITENSNGTVTFDYVPDITTGVSNVPAADNSVKDNKIYTIDGRFVGTDKAALPKGIYIINNKKFVVQ